MGGAMAAIMATPPHNPTPHPRSVVPFMAMAAIMATPASRASSCSRDWSGAASRSSWGSTATVPT
ncbi:hypothetical protein LUU34_01652800 [Aix galericulata]|nr:hypothetical protein LUU34_01652800 [Aix galericulata]